MAFRQKHKLDDITPKHLPAGLVAVVTEINNRFRVLNDTFLDLERSQAQSPNATITGAVVGSSGSGGGVSGGVEEKESHIQLACSDVEIVI
jgi:hypothetical protein